MGRSHNGRHLVGGEEMGIAKGPIFHKEHAAVLKDLCSLIIKELDPRDTFQVQILAAVDRSLMIDVNDMRFVVGVITNIGEGEEPTLSISTMFVPDTEERGDWMAPASNPRRMLGKELVVEYPINISFCNPNLFPMVLEIIKKLKDTTKHGLLQDHIVKELHSQMPDT